MTLRVAVHRAEHINLDWALICGCWINQTLLDDLSRSSPVICTATKQKGQSVHVGAHVIRPLASDMRIEVMLDCSGFFFSFFIIIIFLGRTLLLLLLLF